MHRPVPLLLVAVGLALSCVRSLAQADKVTTVIQSQPLHAGRIDPKLFGNFIELLDDVVPGMWAELLNDRSFEGVVPPANWCYYDGSLDICDRQWDTNATWSYEPENPFNGRRCAKLSTASQTASLTQSGLGVKKGMSYAFSGYLHADTKLKVSVRIKSLLPTGD